MNRENELRGNLKTVHERIETACLRSGRSPDSVTLIVITKNFPAADVRILAGLGVTDIGENRHPEAQHKRDLCLDLGLRWHFVGGLQSNKAAVIASYSDVVHSIDRAKVVSGLSRGAAGADRVAALDCLIQVSLDPTGYVGHRSGARSPELAALGDLIATAPGLTLGGLMAVAPLQESPESAFARLAEVRAEFLVRHPGAGTLSAGMSGDLEEAISAGATHVRVGRSVLGQRPAVK